MQTVHRIAAVVQPARRRRSLATLSSLTSAACLATVLPFAVGIARPAAPDRPRAPRGGIEVAGRFYRGGSFLPTSSPTPIAESAPTPRDDDDAEGPAWTWPAWTDADTWELGSEPEPEPEPATAPTVAAAQLDAHWLGETVALLITRTAIEDDDDSPYYRLDREYSDAFWGFVKSLGWPACTWDSWLALCRSGSPVCFPDPDTRDLAVAFTPSRHDELYRLGYELGLDREPADADAMDPSDLEAFRRGYLAGREEWDARLEIMCGASEYAAFSDGITDREMYPYGGVS